MTLKKFIITSSIVLILAGTVIVSYKYYSDQYKILNAQYESYKEKVKVSLAENINLKKVNDSLVFEVNDLQKEKRKLLSDLSKKEVKIVEVEKIIYKDGALIIPTDYPELKTNYEVLSGLYQQKNIMYTDLKTQSEADYSTIEELKTQLEKLGEQNSKLILLINEKVKPPKKIFEQAILGGFSFGLSGIGYNAAYQVVLYEKFIGQIQLNYPMSVSLLIGVKL